MSKHHTSMKVRARIARKREESALKVSALEAAELVEELQLEEKCGGHENATLLAASIACEMMLKKGFVNLKGIAGVADGLNLLDVVRDSTPELSEMVDDFKDAYTLEKDPDQDLMQELARINQSANRVVWLGNLMIKKNRKQNP